MTTAPSIPTQRRLAIKVPYEAPLMSLPTAAGILELDVDLLLHLVEERALAWAWNIGLGNRRKELRVLTRCVSGFKETNSTCNLGGESVGKIIGYILAREKKPWVKGSRLKLLFACGETHILDLVNARELSVVDGTTWRRGPGGSPLILRVSVEAFLKRRLEPK